ncbi:hypothetical protein I552_3240 [Mycobacterium xenopi 3993]|nr:hypothetical protein I552_3240 [Mycobacterium xenopi 3993]
MRHRWRAYLGSVVVARHRAQAAADLAALAAAARVSAGADVACARAGVVARRMRPATSNAPCRARRRRHGRGGGGRRATARAAAVRAVDTAG